LYYH